MLVYHGSHVAPGGAAQIPGARAQREAQHDTPLRQARTCYNHLAGVAGVNLLDELVRREWLTTVADGERPDYELTGAGAIALAERGVDLAAVRCSGRRLAYGCPDWTEGRLHLAGALASEILAALRAAGVIEQEPGSRAVWQRRSLADWLDMPTGPSRQRPV